ncbi:MAG: hypothetical protein K6F35_11470 [Lachnospiraceae bacterium]|nr:hypothetical protein [Lachnospiraceae bacterium]
MREEELHFSYFFLPFRYFGEDFESFKFRLDSEVWDARPYILKDERNRATLADEERAYSGWGASFYAHMNDRLSENCLYYTLKRSRFGKLEEGVLLSIGGEFYPTPYRVDGVSMMLFTSKVGFVILKFLDTNPNANEYTVAEMCSYLAWPGLAALGTKESNIPLITCIRALFDRDTADRLKFQFHHSKFEDSRLPFLSFNYSEGTPGPFTTDAKQLNRMYVARYGYNGTEHRHPANFEYDDYAEILALDDYVNFGMSPSGLACLAYGCEDQNGSHREYLTGNFLDYFNTGILVMYALLLHQKFMLLLGLRDGAGEETAILYRRVFFSTQFSEDILTQRIYAKAYNQLAIGELYKELDARYPVRENAARVKAASAESEKKGSLPALFAVNTLFSCLAALASMVTFLRYVNSGSRSALWIVIISCILIILTEILTIAYAWDSIQEAFGELLENRRSYKFIIVIGLIFIILLIFVAKWAEFTG